jgi:hypothetical protein
VEHAHHGSYFELCFVKENLDLPLGYYFGVTAQTPSEYADQHEIYLIDVYEINPPLKDVRKASKLTLMILPTGNDHLNL